MTLPRPFQGQFVVLAGTYYNQPSTKLEVSTFAEYEDVKGNTKYRNWVVLGG